MNIEVWVPQETNSEVESKVQNVYQGIAFGIYSCGRVEIKAGEAGYKSGGSAGSHCEILRAEVINQRCSTSSQIAET